MFLSMLSSCDFVLESEPMHQDSTNKPPNLLDHLDEALPVVRESRLGIVLDFDGTISELAPTPDESRISAESAEALESLVRKVTLVAVVSGRAASDLSEKVGLENVVYVGSHGAESLVAGVRQVSPEAAEYSGRIAAVLDGLRSTADAPGIYWENKGLSAAIHFRSSPDPDSVRDSLAEALDSVPGVDELRVFWGKRVLELRAPVGGNKGDALRKLALDHALDSAIFVGDDTTDIDALEAMRGLNEGATLRGLGVAVVSDDSPEGLCEAADFTLDGVAEVGSFLGWVDGAIG